MIEAKKKSRDLSPHKKQGAHFPPVPVIELDDYFSLTPSIHLDTGMMDGGHHRSIAHWRAGRLLPVTVLAINWVSCPFNQRINIRDINLING